MEKTIFFLSTGYRGGANNYLQQNLNYKQKNSRCIWIDRKNFSGSNNKNKNFKYYKVNLLKNIIINQKKLYKIFLKNKKKKNIIFLTNYALIVLYFYLFLKLKRKNFKIVLSIHSGLFNVNFKNIFLSFIFSFFIIIVDKLIYGSSSSKKWWTKFFPWLNLKNSKIIYNGIDIKKFNKKVKKNKSSYNISFVGRLENENNPELFIKIVKSKLNENKKIKFHCFGDGKFKKEILKNKIIFHGWVNKKKIYSISDLIIITSKLNNFPYVALEAKSAGIPVITCSKGDIRKIIFNKKDGYIINDFNVKKIYQKINLIINNYLFYSNNAQKNSQKFDQEKSLKKIWYYIDHER